MLLAELEQGGGRASYTHRALDAIEEIFFVFTAEGEMVQWNRRACEVTGYSDEEIAEMHPVDFVPAEEAESIRRGIATVLEEGHARVEAHLLAKDGRRPIYEFTGSRIEWKGEQLICGTGRDVSERVQVLQDLKALEERYRCLMESAVDGIVISKGSGEIVDWNRGAREIFGYEEREIIGQSVEALMPEHHRSAYREWRRRVHRTGEGPILGETTELEGLRKSGEEFPMELSLSSWEVGGERYFGAIIRDVTEKNKVEEALRESEAKFRVLAEHSMAGVTLIQDGVYQYVNPTYAGYFGYDVEELIGQPPEEVFHPEDRPRVKENIRKRIAGEQRAMRYAARGLTREGQVLHLEIHGARIDYRGRPAIIGTVLDVTERRNLQQEILQIQEEERRRVGQDVHDSIVSQLAGIAMLNGALVRNLKEGERLAPDELEEVTNLLQDTAQQARRLSHGLSPIELERGGLPGALEQLVATTEKQVEISCELYVDVEEELLDLDEEAATHLYRIAQEAVANAVKHAEPSAIEVRLAATEQGLELTVTDDGMGMPELEDEFEGVGLRTMRYRAELIGAQLDIESPSEGGTRVGCRLAR